MMGSFCYLGLVNVAIRWISGIKKGLRLVAANAVVFSKLSLMGFKLSTIF